MTGVEWLLLIGGGALVLQVLRVRSHRKPREAPAPTGEPRDDAAAVEEIVAGIEVTATSDFEGKVAIIDRSVVVKQPPPPRGKLVVAMQLREETDRLVRAVDEGVLINTVEKSRQTSSRTVGTDGVMFFVDTKKGRLVVDARKGAEILADEEKISENDYETLGRIFEALTPDAHASYRKDRHGDVLSSTNVASRLFVKRVCAGDLVVVGGIARDPQPNDLYQHRILEGPIRLRVVTRPKRQP